MALLEGADRWSPAQDRKSRIGGWDVEQDSYTGDTEEAALRTWRMTSNWEVE